MAAERKLLEVSEDELVSLYLHDLLLSHGVPSPRTMSWRGSIARHDRRSIFHAPLVHAQVHEKNTSCKTTVLSTGGCKIVMETKRTGSGSLLITTINSYCCHWQQSPVNRLLLRVSPGRFTD